MDNKYIKMDKVEAEKKILGNYPIFIKNISELIDLNLSKCKDICMINQDWIINEDARFAVYGKFISKLNSTRILLFTTQNFICQENWIDTYNSKFSINGQMNEFIYLKELDTQIRLASYIGFVSEFEATLLIIIRFLQNKKEKC